MLPVFTDNGFSLFVPFLDQEHSDIRDHLHESNCSKYASASLGHTVGNGTLTSTSGGTGRTRGGGLGRGTPKADIGKLCEFYTVFQCQMLSRVKSWLIEEWGFGLMAQWKLPK